MNITDEQLKKKMEEILWPAVAHTERFLAGAVIKASHMVIEVCKLESQSMRDAQDIGIKSSEMINPMIREMRMRMQKILLHEALENFRAATRGRGGADNAEVPTSN